MTLSQSLCCSHTRSMEADEGSNKNQNSVPTGWLRNCIWRKSLRRTKSASCHEIAQLTFPVALRQKLSLQFTVFSCILIYTFLLASFVYLKYLVILICLVDFLSYLFQFHDDTKHIYIFIGGFSLSIAMLLISLLIFFRFRWEIKFGNRLS